jgi:hypothetical protein
VDRTLGPIANPITRLLFYGGIAAATVTIAAAFVFAQHSRWTDSLDEPVAQPVPFSHAHHVGTLGLDCAYCHTDTADSAYAGMPSPDTCMNCHSQLYTNAEALEPVRNAWRTGQPVAWNRVHDLPDFVFFNHAVHIAANLSCITCHGDVADMPLTAKAQPMTMNWCLDCHRDPHAALRAPEPGPALHSPRARPTLGLIEQPVLTNCSACHR